jgi:hypothetical protein
MTRQQTINYLKRQKFHDKSIIRFAKHHRQLQSTELSKAVRWAQKSLRIVNRNLRKLLAPRVNVASGVISALLCIHSHEAAWNDPGYPYWGGLQMDMNFQRAYGPEFLSRWGTADHWPIWAQLKAGARGVAARGYEPWRNTAHMCGLL